MKRQVKRRGKSRFMFRAVSPDGRAGRWRRFEWMAVRDAVYDLKGWGRRSDPITITINAGVAYAFLDEVTAAGWSFRRTCA